MHQSNGKRVLSKIISDMLHTVLCPRQLLTDQLIGVFIQMEALNVEKMHLIHLFFHLVGTEVKLSTRQ